MNSSEFQSVYTKNHKLANSNTGTLDRSNADLDNVSFDQLDQILNPLWAQVTSRKSGLKSQRNKRNQNLFLNESEND